MIRTSEYCGIGRKFTSERTEPHPATLASPEYCSYFSGNTTAETCLWDKPTTLTYFSHGLSIQNRGQCCLGWRIMSYGSNTTSSCWSLQLRTHDFHIFTYSLNERSCLSRRTQTLSVECCGSYSGWIIILSTMKIWKPVKEESLGKDPDKIVNQFQPYLFCLFINHTVVLTSYHNHFMSFLVAAAVCRC